MDALAPLLLIAGAFTIALVGFAFWNWRRSARATERAATSLEADAPLRHNVIGRLRTDEPAINRASVPEDASVLTEYPGGRAEQGQSGVSIGEGAPAELAPPPAAPKLTQIEVWQEDGAARGDHKDDTNDEEWQEHPALDDFDLAAAPAAKVSSDLSALAGALCPDLTDLSARPSHDASPAPVETAAQAINTSASPKFEGTEDYPSGHSLSPPDVKANRVVEGMAIGEAGGDIDETSVEKNETEADEEKLPESSGDNEDESGVSDSKLLGALPVTEDGAQTTRPRNAPRQPAVHRDLRGRRRATGPVNAPASAPAADAASRAPAEARLRLMLHPIRRTAALTLVLMRPEGFPERVTPMMDGVGAVQAYDVQRYDDLDTPWSANLLTDEIRIVSWEGYKWVRGARQVHIFGEDPTELGLMSVGAARTGAVLAVICRIEDEAGVRAAAECTGSPDLVSHERWHGIPDGWVVLSDFKPCHAAALPLPAAMRPLDPGEAIDIAFEGGLAIRSNVFAQRHPPRISISPVPEGASVTIGGQPAAQVAGGGWEAQGWDAPGRHMVDVVPGPSLTYEIAADPASAEGWEFWDAHPERFGTGAKGPWARAEICGASVRGAAGQTVIAGETQAILVALGTSSGAVMLQPRGDAPASVALVPQPPAFLISASGPRRSQGRVIWLGLASAAPRSRLFDLHWAAEVRAAASRRLPLEAADLAGEQAWRRARERARRMKRPRK